MFPVVRRTCNHVFRIGNAKFSSSTIPFDNNSTNWFPPGCPWAPGGVWVYLPSFYRSPEATSPEIQEKPRKEAAKPKEETAPKVYVPNVKDAFRVLQHLEGKGVLDPSVVELLIADEMPEEAFERLVKKALPMHLWDPAIWKLSDKSKFLISGYSFPRGHKTVINPSLSVNDLFGDEDTVLLFQNAVAAPDDMNEHHTPSQFAISMMKEAKTELNIAVYSMHENQGWDLFTETVRECLQKNQSLRVKLVCHPNIWSKTVLERLADIHKQFTFGGESRLHFKCALGASPKGQQHAKIWTNGEVALIGSLNISEPAFIMNMECGTGHRKKSHVRAIQRQFDLIWDIAFDVDLNDILEDLSN